MTTKNTFCTLAFIAFSAIILISCKKSSSSASPIVGTWNLYQIAEDDNSNGVADPTEITPVAGTGESEVVTFNNNGSGSVVATYSGSTQTEAFIWSLTNSNTSLTVTVTGNPPGTNSVSITNTTLILEDTTETPITWSYYSKQ